MLQIVKSHQCRNVYFYKCSQNASKEWRFKYNWQKMISAFDKLFPSAFHYYKRKISVFTQKTKGSVNLGTLALFPTFYCADGRYFLQ